MLHGNVARSLYKMVHTKRWGQEQVFSRCSINAAIIVIAIANCLWSGKIEL